jgi:hypothetical protein
MRQIRRPDRPQISERASWSTIVRLRREGVSAESGIASGSERLSNPPRNAERRPQDHREAGLRAKSAQVSTTRAQTVAPQVINVP